MGRISKLQPKLSPDANGCQTPQLQYSRGEVQLKPFCAMGQHHEREEEEEEEEAGKATGLQRAAFITAASRCPPAALMRCTSRTPSGLSQARGRWCRATGTWFTSQGGRLSHSLEWAQPVWSLLLEKYSAFGGRRNRYYPAQTRVHPNEGGRAGGHTALQILLY